jgi:hypothetical protein
MNNEKSKQQGVKLLTTFMNQSTKFNVKKKHNNLYLTDNGLLAKVPECLANIKTNLTAKDWKIYDETLELKDDPVYINKDKIKNTLKETQGDNDSYLIRIDELTFLKLLQNWQICRTGRFTQIYTPDLHQQPFF